MRKQILAYLTGAALLLTAAFICTGCNTAVNNGTGASGNTENSFDVAPTQPADPLLKGTQWKYEGGGSRSQLHF